MRHALWTAGFALLASWATLAQAEQSNSCTTNVSRIGFTDQIEGGQPFELWKCQDQWHLSNLGNQQIYIDEKGKPCVKNSTTGAVFCCPNVSLDGKTKAEAPQDDSMAGKFSCVGPKSFSNPKPEDKNNLLIVPAATGGSRSSTVYRVTGSAGEESGQNGQAKKKTRDMTVEVELPEGADPSRKSGTLTVASEVNGASSGTSGKKGGPKNPCNKAETAEGSFCQLPANILGHSYRLNKETKGAVLDTQDGNDKSVTSSSEGKTRTSEGGAGAAR
jgi:hypothetical protein